MARPRGQARPNADRPLAVAPYLVNPRALIPLAKTDHVVCSSSGKNLIEGSKQHVMSRVDDKSGRN